MPISIVPAPARGPTVYQVLNDLGEHYGRVWSEVGEDEANEPTIIQWIIEGQFERPVRVIAFNVDEGWSRDVNSRDRTEASGPQSRGHCFGRSRARVCGARNGFIRDGYCLAGPRLILSKRWLPIKFT
jgi:hypothetical protein